MGDYTQLALFEAETERSAAESIAPPTKKEERKEGASQQDVPSPLERTVQRETRFGFKPADFNQQYAHDKDLTHILTGLLNLQDGLGREMGAFCAILNPDEIVAYAYAIGRRAYAGVKAPTKKTLYEQMHAINELMYDQRHGVKGGILTLLQERARRDEAKYHPVKSGSLKRRMEELAEQRPQLAQDALTVYVSARRAGRVHPDYADDRIVSFDAPEAMPRSRQRSSINGLIDYAWHHAQGRSIYTPAQQPKA